MKKRTRKIDGGLKKIGSIWRNWEMKIKIWVIYGTHTTNYEEVLGTRTLERGVVS